VNVAIQLAVNSIIFMYKVQRCSVALGKLLTPVGHCHRAV